VITAQRAAYHCCAAIAIIGFWGDEVKSARFGDSRANQSPRGNRLFIIDSSSFSKEIS
jgi:hypothetical protein